jgi:hypothetical protein
MPGLIRYLDRLENEDEWLLRVSELTLSPVERRGREDTRLRVNMKVQCFLTAVEFRRGGYAGSRTGGRESE